MKNLKKVGIQVKNLQELKAAVEFLSKFTDCKIWQKIFQNHWFNEFSPLYVGIWDNMINPLTINDLQIRGYYKIYSFSEIHKILLEPDFTPIIVSLNNEYKAEIQEDGSVKVGCQTFDYNKIQELSKACQARREEYANAQD